jgi:hypothetical protein
VSRAQTALTLQIQKIVPAERKSCFSFRASSHFFFYSSSHAFFRVFSRAFFLSSVFRAPLFSLIGKPELRCYLHKKQSKIKPQLRSL